MKNLTALIFFSTFIFAAIINVPDDHLTIQEGINASANGDTVLVQPGIYVENINFNGLNITLASLFLLDGNPGYISETVIDGNESGSVVTFENSESQAAILIGFTITNGHSSTSGGGVKCIGNVHPRLEHLFIVDNSAQYNGGGIICGAAGSPYITDVSIVNNSAGGNSSGIYCYNYSSPTLSNVIITDNTAHNGGGICCLEHSSPSLDDVSITNNFASANGGGIICAFSSSPNLQSVVISGNSSANGGGGIYCSGYSSPHLEEVTLEDNSSQSGGGIYCDENSYPYMNSVTVRNNTAVTIGGGIYCSESSDLLFSEFHLCNIYLNDASQGRDLYTNGFLAVVVDTFTVAIPTDIQAYPRENFTFDIITGFLAVNGDVNGDGVLDILDIVRVVAIILGANPANSELSVSDLNADGILNVQDIILILNIILGS